MSTDPKSTTVQRHPVADLLTDEQRALVSHTKFVATRNGVSAESDDNERRCPLAVAVGMGCSVRPYVYRALGVSEPHPDVESFMKWADSARSNPADVYALLGCEQP